MVLESFHIGEPLAIGRPCRIDAALGLVEEIGVDEHRLPLVDVDGPEVEPLIRVGEPLGVGRPNGRVEERWIGERDRRLRCEAALVPEHEVVLATRVGEIGDALAVGRPRRVALRHARSGGEIAHVAFLGRHGEDVAARLDHRPRPGRGESGVLNEGHGARPVRTGGREVRVHVDVHGLGRPLGRVEEIHPAALLVHDHAGPGRRGLDVEVGVTRQLARLPGPEIVAVQVHRAVAIGQEVHHVADPHRPVFSRRIVRHRLDLARAHVEQPDPGLLAAAVAAPRLLVPGAAHRDVRDASRVRAVRQPLTGRHGQRLFEPSFERHAVQAVEVLDEAARRCEHDPLAVRRPPLHQVRLGVPREPSRLAAFRGDDIDVGVAGVIGAERDPAAVGREAGVSLEAGCARELARLAAGPGHDPQVPGIDECDRAGADRRHAEQQGVVRRQAPTIGRREREREERRQPGTAEHGGA